MSYSLSSRMMKEIDRYSIEDAGILSEVLMERAALCVANELEQDIPRLGPKAEVRFNADASCASETADKRRVCVVYGPGNNGGDGLAVARILAIRGWTAYAVPADQRVKEKLDAEVAAMLHGDAQKAAESIGLSAAARQYLSACKCDVHMEDADMLGELVRDERMLFVDAIFGIGLTRNVEGAFAAAVEALNSVVGDRVYSVDIPSGISSDNGQVLGVAVRASKTITFGYMKHGILLYPGTEYSGEVITGDAGFAITPDILRERAQTASRSSEEGITGSGDICSFYESMSEIRLPKRSPASNKGSYGRVLFIGAADGCAGAGYLSAAAAYYSGAGLVRALVGADAVTLINARLPEAMTGVLFYRATEAGPVEEKSVGAHKLVYDPALLAEGIEWASVIVIGPGLGKSGAAADVLRIVRESGKTVVVDADALNIIADELTQPGVRETDMQDGAENTVPDGTDRARSIAELFAGEAVLTPHIGEFSRLTGRNIAEIKAHVFDMASEYAYNNKLTYVCKDARTVIAHAGQLHININGNNGMSTGGCGDVLAGLVGGLIACGMEPSEAARTAVYLHAAAGDRAASEGVEDSMLASDLLMHIPGVIRDLREFAHR